MRPNSILNGLWTPEQSTEISPWIKMCLFGDPGSGKTLFAATAPKPLILDTEGSTEVLDDWPDIKAQCKILYPRSWDDINEILYALISGDPRLADRQTVVIDTMTEYQRKNLDEIVIGAAGKDATHSLFLPHQQDYKMSTEMVRRMAGSFRDLPYHLILVAHRTEDTDNVGRVRIRPELTPKLAGTIKSSVGLQAFMGSQVVIHEDHSEEFHNYLWTRQTEQIEAKTRYRHLPTYMLDPKFSDLLHFKNLSSTGEAT